jgi:predicted alpha-1,2-mannosidase
MAVAMRFSLIALVLLSVGACAQAASLADLPDPLVGTDSRYELSRGNTYPGIFVPHGALAWTAQTGKPGWIYQWDKDRMWGFRATHAPSAWMADYGAFRIQARLGYDTGHEFPSFSHKEEDARAYRYAVTLHDRGVAIRAEMTPSAHGAMFRFAYPATNDAVMILDPEEGTSEIAIHPGSRSITGYAGGIRGNYPANFKQYFVAVFDRPLQSCAVRGRDVNATAMGSLDGACKELSEAATSKGSRVGAAVRFSLAAGERVTVRIAVSLISAEQARRNLDAEQPDDNFDAAVARAKTAWEKELSRFQLTGGTADERRTFYTALYHVLQFPHALHEQTQDGTWAHDSPYDGQVHAGELYADDGFWDTFRAKFPLLALAWPKRDASIIRGLLNAASEGGRLPKWPNPGYSNVMISTHADSLISDAYAKGIRDYDVDAAYAQMLRDTREPGAGRYQARSGILDYLKLGYVPADKVRESASCTLEYAYDDFCVARMAHALGHAEDAARLEVQSKNYRNLFDKQTGFMRGRLSDGRFVEPFNPLDWGGVYTEGNAWQWLWSVQHDVAGLMELLGGREAFLQKLDTLFSMTNEYRVGGYGEVIHEMTEAKLADTGQYAHINEPVHHVIYLYDYAGQPWKTQYWTRAIAARFYRPGAAGWLGDEDTGQMSAWYVFSTLGFYPVNPGQPIYALTSPIFDRATLRPENGHAFTVEVQRQKPGAIYIQSATLDGKPLERCWITHEEILRGGTLRFVLGLAPNRSWGTGGIPNP